MPPAPLLTFVICSWRAPESLDATLESVASNASLDVTETVLVNNGFGEARESALLAAFGERINLRILREPRPGLGFARRCAFLAARGEVWVLLDDDNTIAPDFIPHLRGLLAAHANLGGVSPIVLPVWEKTPPLWLPHFGLLCLSYTAAHLGDAAMTAQTWPASQFADALRPPGGGMIIHRRVGESYLASLQDERRLALARTCDQLVGCEDEDIFSFVEATGRDVVYFPTLRVYHRIPAARMKLRYLLRLNYQMMHSYGTLERLRPRRPTSRAAEVRQFAVVSGWYAAQWLRCRLTTPALLCHLTRRAGWLAGYW